MIHYFKEDVKNEDTKYYTTGLEKKGDNYLIYERYAWEGFEISTKVVDEIIEKGSVTCAYSTMTVITENEYIWGEK